MELPTWNSHETAQRTLDLGLGGGPGLGPGEDPSQPQHGLASNSNYYPIWPPQPHSRRNRSHQDHEAAPEAPPRVPTVPSAATSDVRCVWTPRHQVLSTVE